MSAATGHQMLDHEDMDSLYRDSPATHAVLLPVLGIRTRFETNSARVLEAVEESFGWWRQLDSEAVSREPDVLRVRVMVHGDDASSAPAERAVIRHSWIDATRLLVQSSHAVGMSDPERREAVGYVSASLVANRQLFRSAVLEALTLSLLSCFDRHPVHAAAVANRDRVVLLAAPSGTGKSTISYVALSSGLELLSDDRVWIQLHPSLQLWSSPRPLRLMPEATATFPELAALALVEIDGKRKIEVFVRGHVAPRTAGEIVTCAMQRPGGSLASLGRATSSDLESALLDQLAPGFDRYPERQRRVMSELSAHGGWRLTLGESPQDALPLLLEMLGG